MELSVPHISHVEKAIRPISFQYSFLWKIYPISIEWNHPLANQKITLKWVPRRSGRWKKHVCFFRNSGFNWRKRRCQFIRKPRITSASIVPTSRCTYSRRNFKYLDKQCNSAESKLVCAQRKVLPLRHWIDSH